MLDENLQLKLLRGSDIKIDKEITIKSYTINNIIDDIGINLYNEFLRYIVYTPYDLRASLYESGIIHSNISHWDMFINHVFNMSDNKIREATKCLIGVDIVTYFPQKNNNGEIFLASSKGNVLDAMKFNHIVNILREINGLPPTNKEPKFGNERALIYEVERQIRRIKKGRKVDGDVSLKSIISSIMWSNSGMDVDKIWELTLYQLYDGLNRKIKKDRYDNLMLGVYTGNVKYDSINFNKENWFTN